MLRRLRRTIYSVPVFDSFIFIWKPSSFLLYHNNFDIWLPRVKSLDTCQKEGWNIVKRTRGAPEPHYSPGEHACTLGRSMRRYGGYSFDFRGVKPAGLLRSEVRSPVRSGGGVLPARRNYSFERIMVSERHDSQNTHHRRPRQRQDVARAASISLDLSADLRPGCIVLGPAIGGLRDQGTPRAQRQAAP